MPYRIVTVIDEQETSATVKWERPVSHRDLNSLHKVEDGWLGTNVRITGSAQAILEELVRLGNHSDSELKELAHKEAIALLRRHSDLIAWV